MGSSISKIYDDIDDYEDLCKKYNEKSQKVYSNHHNWLIEKTEGKTKLSFKEYDKQKDIESLKYEIKRQKEKLKSLEKDLKKLNNNI